MTAITISGVRLAALGLATGVTGLAGVPDHGPGVFAAV
jgi:hypothetical protein